VPAEALFFGVLPKDANTDPLPTLKTVDGAPSWEKDEGARKSWARAFKDVYVIFFLCVVNSAIAVVRPAKRK